MSTKQEVINLIKPPGMSSFQAVKHLRRISNIKKAGHTGTLDPTAAGILPVCMGKATKAIPYLDEKKKEYIAEITLGITTETLDREGEILSRNKKWKYLNSEKIKEIVFSFTGSLDQIPPMYSAAHHQGKRLYKLAREGKEIKREPRPVEIYDIEIINIDLPIVKLRIECSKGTYIRSLARDIGEKLEVGAYLSFLIRSCSGPFSFDNAFTFEEVLEFDDRCLMSIDKFLDYPALEVKKGRGYKRAINGNMLGKNEIREKMKNINNNDIVLIYGPGGKFISINKIIIEDKLIIKPEKVFI